MTKEMTAAAFERTQERINNIPRFTKKHDRTALEAYLDALGSPDLSGSRVIHIAGTNGKGSTACYLSHCLQEAGYHVLTFISPHLVTMRERMVYDGEMIGEEDFVRIADRIEEVQKEDQFTPPTFFEYLFLMAEVWAGEKRPDWVILETGLGGRLDATNSVRRKDLTIITRIGMDHMQILGDTITRIAGEKAGILRPGVPAVVLDVPEEALLVFQKRAKMLGAPLHVVRTDKISARQEEDRFVDFFYDFSYDNSGPGPNTELSPDKCLETDTGLCLRTDSDPDKDKEPQTISARLYSPALYQAENAALSTLAVKVLNEKESAGAGISMKALKRGLEAARWPGRMEEVLPRFFVDGAHNSDGMSAFLKTAEGIARGKEVLFVYAAMKDKTWEDELSMIGRAHLADALLLIPLSLPRAVDEVSFKEAVEKGKASGIKMYDSARVLTAGEGAKKALALVRSYLLDHPEGTAFAAGSLYLVGEIRGLLQKEKEDRTDCTG